MAIDAAMPVLMNSMASAGLSDKAGQRHLKFDLFLPPLSRTWEVCSILHERVFEEKCCGRRLALAEQ